MTDETKEAIETVADTTAAPAPADLPAAAPGQPMRLETKITCSRGFYQWLALHNCSLAFTSYLTGLLFFVVFIYY